MAPGELRVLAAILEADRALRLGVAVAEVLDATAAAHDVDRARLAEHLLVMTVECSRARAALDEQERRQC